MRSSHKSTSLTITFMARKRLRQAIFFKASKLFLVYALIFSRWPFATDRHKNKYRPNGIKTFRRIRHRYWKRFLPLHACKQQEIQKGSYRPARKNLIVWKSLASITQHIHDHIRHRATGQRNMLDARPNHVPVGNGNDVCDTVTGVNNSTGQLSALSLPILVRPYGSKYISNRHIEEATVTSGVAAKEAYNAITACTAMYRAGTLNVSNIISAVYSRFSGVFRGGSV